MNNTESWKSITTAKHQILNTVTHDVCNKLATRPSGPRNEKQDNLIVESLTTATAVAISSQNYQLAVELFNTCYGIIVDYERHLNCEVHKGAMAFNVAIAYLRSNDFPSAMHYFEFAETETRLTIGEVDWGVYECDLFKNNFWQVVDLYQQESPLAIYDELWPVRYGSASAMADWTTLKKQSRLLYLICTAERIDLRRLRAIPGLPVSNSFGLACWTLTSNLCRLIETELIARNVSGRGLRAKVLHGIVGSHSPITTFHSVVTHLDNAHKVGSPTEFNTHFPAIRHAIEDGSKPRDSRVAAAAYLAGVARNQVQHQVDDKMVLFCDRGAAMFTIDVLMCLCRIGEWAS
jgi:hypothetical protein